jgi:hypothetical protein
MKSSVLEIRHFRELSNALVKEDRSSSNRITQAIGEPRQENRQKNPARVREREIFSRSRSFDPLALRY